MAETEYQFNETSICLLIFLVILWIMLFRLIIKLLRQRYGLYPGRPQDKRISAKRRIRRYQTIEHWLVSKRVISHDAVCDVCCNSEMVNDTTATEETGVETTKEKTVNDEKTTVIASSSATSQNTNQSRGEESNSTESGLVKSSTYKSTLEKSFGICADSLNESSTDLSSTDSSQQIRLCGESVEHAVYDDDDEGGDPDEEMTEADDSGDLDLEAGECSIDEPPPNQCAICLGTFRAGDVVSWSGDEKCQHVFHHECIKEWLARRAGCPVCRRTMLLVDRCAREDKEGYYAYSHVTKALGLGNPKPKPTQLKKWSDQFVSRAAATYCCDHHGLVTVSSSLMCRKDELKQLTEHIIGTVVHPSELQEMRGSRQDATTTSVADFDPIEIEDTDP